MLVFIVPIKSSQVSTNWEVFSVLVERTMKSICQQTSSNFKVVAVCHEKPKIAFEHPSLEFASVDFDPPTEEVLAASPSGADKNYRNAAKEADKAKKIMHGIEIAKKHNPDHFMVVDADDCISKDLVKFVENQSADIPGWYFRKGYIYNEGSNLIFLNNNTFNILCGTCIIIRSEFVDQLLDEKPLALFHHDLINLKDNKSLIPLPFPGAIYSIGNTENYCSTPEAVKKMNSYKILSKAFFENIVRKLAKYRPKLVTTQFRNKYGMYKLDFSRVFS